MIRHIFVDTEDQGRWSCEFYREVEVGELLLLGGKVRRATQSYLLPSCDDGGQMMVVVKVRKMFDHHLGFEVDKVWEQP